MDNKDIHPNHLIFSDLDGTLLDHDTYQFNRAAKALEQIDKLGIPLILNTSKTVAEVRRIRSTLKNTDPFIAENGSIVAVPKKYFPFELGKDYLTDGDQTGLLIRRLGGHRDEILDIIRHLRRKHGFAFTGFNDLNIQELSQITGLPRAQATLSKQRLSTEPITWEDSAAQLDIFLARLAENNLQAVQGGRFLSVSRPFDKKDGVAALMSLYEKINPSGFLKIGLGDSPNDQGMLEMMDIAVIIQSEKSNQIHLNHPGQVIRTQNPGPEGWQEAIDQILRR